MGARTTGEESRWGPIVKLTGPIVANYTESTKRETAEETPAVGCKREEVRESAKNGTKNMRWTSIHHEHNHSDLRYTVVSEALRSN